MPNVGKPRIPDRDLRFIAAGFGLADIRSVTFMNAGLMNRNWPITGDRGQFAVRQPPLPDEVAGRTAGPTAGRAARRGRTHGATVRSLSAGRNGGRQMRGVGRRVGPPRRRSRSRASGKAGQPIAGWSWSMRAHCHAD
jgi:hypothetical protein